MRTARLVVSIGAVVALAACGSSGGGGGGGIPSGTPTPTNTSGPSSVQATISITVGSSGTQTAARRRKLSVSPSTLGVTIAAYTSPRAQHTTALASASFNVSAGATGCTGTAGNQKCTLTVGLPSTGTFDIVVTTFDAPPVNGAIPGTAKQLGIGIASAQTITKGSNLINYIVNGIPATITLAPQATPGPEVDSTSIPVVVSAQDADENTIIADNYADVNGNTVTITPTVTGTPSANFSFTPASVTAPGTVSLNYSASNLTSAEFSGGQTVTLGATSTNGATIAGTPEAFTYAPGTVLAAIDQSHPGAGPTSITIANGAIWYTISGTYSALATIPVGLTGTQQQWQTTTHSTLGGITFNTDGNLWFTETSADNFGSIGSGADGTTIGTLGIENPAGASTVPQGITHDASGNLWFVLCNTNQIGEASPPKYLVSTTNIPTSSAQASQIVLGPDGNIWFTEIAANKIGMLNTGTDVITEYTVPTPDVSPTDIVVGADGALWFTEAGGNSVGRITTAGAVTEIPLPPSVGGNNPPLSEASSLVVGSDGNIWLAALGYFGRVAKNTSGTGYTTTVFDFEVKPPPTSMVTGPDGNIYYPFDTAGTGNAIGVIYL